MYNDFPDCQYCGYPGCNGHCICSLCENGPYIHLDDCPYDADTEEEFTIRSEQEPYKTIMADWNQEDKLKQFEELHG